VNKRTIALVVAALFFTSPVYADDLCRISKKILDMTTVEANRYFKDTMKGWSVDGRGSIYDVRKRSNGHRIIVGCLKGNAFADVWVTSSVSSLKKGQIISWRGESYGFRIGRYTNNPSESYIEVVVKDGSFR